MAAVTPARLHAASTHQDAEADGALHALRQHAVQLCRHPALQRLTLALKQHQLCVCNSQGSVLHSLDCVNPRLAHAHIAEGVWVLVLGAPTAGRQDHAQQLLLAAAREIWPAAGVPQLLQRVHDCREALRAAGLVVGHEHQPIPVLACCPQQLAEDVCTWPGCGCGQQQQ